MYRPNLHSIKVYLKPFDEDETYQSDWIDITKHVLDVGRSSEAIDSADYQIGVYNNSSVSIKLNNRDGKFGDVGEDKSYFFHHSRKDSQVKITYDIHHEEPVIGVAELGEFFLGDEEDIFIGLLNDETFRLSASAETASFEILGMESLFERTIVPFSSINVGDDVEDIIYICLNQSTITDLLTVGISNINVGQNEMTDAVADLEGKTVREALDELLLLSNSVLYIRDLTIHVAERTVGTSSVHTFYGQGSTSGPESILDLRNFNSGLHRTFNYFKWEDTAVIVQDADSVTALGIRKKEIGYSYYTDQTKRENIMGALLAEFKDKKDELEIKCDLNYDTLAINLLDKVNVDYPVVYYQTEGTEYPICGIAICGEAVLPKAMWTLEIDVATDFKIMSKSYDFKKLEMTFKLREA